jgi:type IV pilus assembly protein PilO
MAMNLSLNKLPWYGQIGLFVVLSLAGAGVFWHFYASPTGAAIEARRQEFTKIRAEVDKGLATARRLPQFREDVAKLEGDLDRLRAVLPEEKDVGDLLRRIQTLATQSNLQIKGFKPAPIVTKQMHAEWPISLELDGTYHNLGVFFDRVGKFSRIINIGGVTIKAKDKPQPGSTVGVVCTATTFVLIEPQAAAKGKGAAKKPAAPGKAS